MKLSDLITIISVSYDPAEPQMVSQFFKDGKLMDAAERKALEAGDTLAEFVAVEINETFNPAAPSKDQLREAQRVLNSAVRQLLSVEEALDRANK